MLTEDCGFREETTAMVLRRFQRPDPGPLPRTGVTVRKATPLTGRGTTDEAGVGRPCSWKFNTTVTPALRILTVSSFSLISTIWRTPSPSPSDKLLRYLGWERPGPGGITSQARLVLPIDVIPVNLTSKFTTFVAGSLVTRGGSFSRNGLFSRMSLYGLSFNPVTSPRTVAPANSAPIAKLKVRLVRFMLSPFSLVPATRTNLVRTNRSRCPASRVPRINPPTVKQAGRDKVANDGATGCPNNGLADQFFDVGLTPPSSLTPCQEA